MLSKIYKPFIPINYNTLKILQNKYGTPFQLYDESGIIEIFQKCVMKANQIVLIYS